MFFRVAPSVRASTVFTFNTSTSQAMEKKNISDCSLNVVGRGKLRKNIMKLLSGGNSVSNLGVLGIKCLGKHSIRDYFAAMLIQQNYI